MRGQESRLIGVGVSEEAGPVISDRLQRRCVITRNLRPKEQLLRFVLDPNGCPVADLSGRLPGRGVYVLPSQGNIRTFLKRRGVKGAEAEEMLLTVGMAISRRFLQGLGLARRAGCLLRGFRDVAETVQSGQEPLLLLASDTAANTREKLERLIRKHGVEEPWELLDRARFGAACGNNGPLAILAVTRCGMIHRVRTDALRWRDFFDS